MNNFDEEFPKIMSKYKVKGFPREAFYELKEFMKQWVLEVIPAECPHHKSACVCLDAITEKINETVRL